MLKQLLLLQCLVISLIGGQNNEIWDKDLQQHVTVFRDVATAVRSDPAYRLPVTVYPLDYDVDIDLNFEATADHAAYSYDGRVTIIIEAAAVNVTQVVLHANVDRINAVSIIKNDGTPVFLNTMQPIEIVPLYHFLKINLIEPLEYLINYTLVIDYSSTMNEGPLRRGIWRGQYIDANGVVRTYATTHFQPYNARQAFPCWDEPGFKATFTLHLTMPTTHSAVYSNTQLSVFRLLNGRIRNTFSKTPLMSSYLLTFLVSESFQVIAEDTTFEPPIRIIGRSNAVGLADKALEWAVGMTRYFNEYFGIPYESMDPNLNNDHISSPDWASAGTENWGMVSYRELYMVLDPRETIMSTEHYAATLVSHELAHKWFGNLITCDWWGNTWINEGFASYFGYIATSNVFPEYEHQHHFNARYMHSSLATDSALNPSPLNHDVSTPLEVTGHFGTISYSKGAAFLRMIVDMITEETFRKACQYFLTDNSYRATSRVDLYEAFARAINDDQRLVEYPNFSFEEFYYTWVDRAGYPVLNVVINYNTGEMSLSQERYFLSESATPTNDVYPIPITYTTASNPDFTQLKPIAMMSGSNMVLTKESGEEWVIFNTLQHGHYRVNYGERSWELIINALLYNRESIHYLNRGAIVDDVFAFMRSGHLSYRFGLRILSFLSNEINYHVWEPAITGYTWLRNRLRHLPDRQAEFDNIILNQMEAAIQHVGYDVIANETPTTSQLRQDLLHFACLLKHQRCVEESRTRFLAMKAGTWIDPRIRRNVYVVGIREGDSSDFEFLMNRYMNSNLANDQLEMMRALAATKDPVLLERYMEFTLTDAIRQHDKTNAFNYALLGNNENAEPVLQFLMTNIDRIRASYISEAPSRPVHTVMSNMAAYLDESGLVEYENWLRSTQANSAEFATAISGITSASSNIAWGTTNADNILSAARGGSTTITASFAMLVIVYIMTLFI